MLREPGQYQRAYATGQTLIESIGDMLRHAGLPAKVLGHPVMFDVVFADGSLTDYRHVMRGDAAAVRRFNQTIRANGVLKSDGKTYVSTAHTEADIKVTLDAFATAIDAELSWRKAA